MTSLVHARRLALAAVLAGASLSFAVPAPARAQFFGAKKSGSKDLQIRINGRDYRFISGMTKAAEIIQAMGEEPTLVIKNPDGGRTLIWAEGEIMRPTLIAGPNIQSYVYNFDAEDTFLSETVRDDSNNPEIRAARNKQLAALLAKAKERQANAGKALNEAQMALLVMAGNSRCNWPLSAADLRKANALVKAYRPYTNEIDYNIMIARQGETSPIEQNEFCFGTKWRGIFNNAVATLKATQAPAP